MRTAYWVWAVLQGCGMTAVPMPWESWEVREEANEDEIEQRKPEVPPTLAARVVMRERYVGSFGLDGQQVWSTDGQQVWRTDLQGGRTLQGIPFKDETTINDKESLVVSGGYLWWQRLKQHRIYRRPLQGGTEEVVLERSEGPYTFRVLGSTLYWVEDTGLYGLDDTGGVFQLTQLRPTLLSVSESRLYWVESGSPILHWRDDDQQGSLPLPEGALQGIACLEPDCYALVAIGGVSEVWDLSRMERLARVIQEATPTLAVTPSHIFWPNTTKGLWRLPRLGGMPTPIDSPSVAHSLVASPSALFWIGYSFDGSHLATLPL